MRRIVTAITGAALALSMVASAIPANAAVAGYNSEYTFQSDWMTRSPGEQGTWSVVFKNTGTTTWTPGTSTAVELAVCLDDKVTCNVSDPKEAPFNNAWVSATRYARMIPPAGKTSVATGDSASFIVNITVPTGQAAGTYFFNAAVVKADTGEDIRNEGAYFEVKVPAAAAAQGITVTPATDTNTVGQTHTVTATLRNSAGAVQANTAVDFFVTTDAAPTTSSGACNRATAPGSVSVNSTGANPCQIDAADPLTDQNGNATFTFVGNAAGTYRVTAWTAAQGTIYNSSAGLTQGTATKIYIAAVSTVDATPEADFNSFTTSHTVTATLKDSGGTAVPLAGATIRFIVIRGSSTAPLTGHVRLSAGTGFNPATTTTTTGTCTGGTAVTVGSGTTDAAGTATFTYSGPADPTPTNTPGSGGADFIDDCIRAFYDANNNGVQDATGEPADDVSKTWTDATGGTGVTLRASPTTDANAVSTTHTVTATLTDINGQPVAGKQITFGITRSTGTPGGSVEAVPASPCTATPCAAPGPAVRTTDASGVATFSYTGPSVASDDLITVCYDADADTACEGGAGPTFTGGEINGTVTKDWTVEGPVGGFTGTVISCDTTADRVHVNLSGGSGAGQVFYNYDANDQYTVGAAPTTQATFESNCSSGDLISGNYSATRPEGISAFNLTNQ